MAGSKIGATLVGNNESQPAEARAVSKAVLPGSPLHLLWFLGMGQGPSSSNEPTTPQPLFNLNALKEVTTRLPQSLASSASASSTALVNTSKDLWTGLTGLTSSASEWMFGPTVAPAAQDTDDNSLYDEGSFRVPEFDRNSWGATPRPVFRRRKPTPSFVHGYSVGSHEPSKYTIMHVDAQFHPRDVYFPA